MASGTIKSSAIERFDIPAISTSQTECLGYGIYDAEKNTVRVYFMSKGTTVSSIYISAPIPEKYRPTASKGLIGIVNGTIATCGMTADGKLYQTFSSSHTSTFIVGEYSI